MSICIITELSHYYILEKFRSCDIIYWAIAVSYLYQLENTVVPTRVGVNYM